MKVVAYKGQYRITIPKDIAEEKEWKPGTKLRFIEKADGTIVLKKIEDENARKKK